LIITSLFRLIYTTNFTKLSVTLMCRWRRWRAGGDTDGLAGWPATVGVVAKRAWSTLSGTGARLYSTRAGWAWWRISVRPRLRAF